MDLSTGKRLTDDMQRWFDAFMAERKVLGISHNTQQSYANSFNIFYEYCMQHNEAMRIENIDRRFIIGFISYMQTDYGYSSGSIDTIMRLVKMLFGFITQTNNQLTDFTLIFKNIKKRGAAQKQGGLGVTADEMFSGAERKKIKDALLSWEKEADTFWEIRNILIIKLLRLSGLRVSELLSLKLQNFQKTIVHRNDDSKNTEYYEIEFYGKGNKHGVAHIPKKAVEKELLYIQKHIDHDTHLACSKSGKQLSRMQLFNITKEFLQKRAGLDKQGVHIFRHTFATELIENGIDISVVSKLLRHESIQITAQYYAHIDRNHRMGAMNALGEAV